MSYRDESLVAELLIAVEDHSRHVLWENDCWIPNVRTPWMSLFAFKKEQHRRANTECQALLFTADSAGRKRCPTRLEIADIKKGPFAVSVFRGRKDVDQPLGIPVAIIFLHTDEFYQFNHRLESYFGELICGWRGSEKPFQKF